ncbi:GIY-YIG nuclease family protein [uncultured Maribacter sp.]|tara:strand:+ start:2315 stop:2419 length:105 start_codon:yes stop_codon:yes gene_type:complete
MKGYVYITTNKNKTVLYVGATDDIKRRVNKLNES